LQEYFPVEDKPKDPPPPFFLASLSFYPAVYPFSIEIIFSPQPLFFFAPSLPRYTPFPRSLLLRRQMTINSNVMSLLVLFPPPFHSLSSFPLSRFRFKSDPALFFSAFLPSLLSEPNLQPFLPFWRFGHCAPLPARAAFDPTIPFSALAVLPP